MAGATFKFWAHLACLPDVPHNRLPSILSLTTDRWTAGLSDLNSWQPFEGQLHSPLQAGEAKRITEMACNQFRLTMGQHTWILFCNWLLGFPDFTEVLHWFCRAFYSVCSRKLLADGRFTCFSVILISTEFPWPHRKQWMSAQDSLFRASWNLGSYSVAICFKSSPPPKKIPFME